MPFAYPIALELTGRRCVVVGGDGVAAAKAESLLDAGGRVAVIAAAPCAALTEREGRGELLIERRAYRYGDLAGAFLVVSCDPAANATVYAEAEARGVLCNAVDDIAHSHFAAPSVVRRGDLLLTVSTGGRSPALAKRLRRRLADEFGAEYGILVDLLGAARRLALAGRTCDFATWARRWDDVVASEEELLTLVRTGRVEEATRRVFDRLSGPTADPNDSVVIRPELFGSDDDKRRGSAQPCDLKPASTSPQVSGSVR
jgi:siroheme synthase-like protein